MGLSPKGVSQEGPTAAPGSPWDGDAAPPLIERELFFSDPQIANSQLSPDGDWIAFQRPLDGVMNVWVKGLEDDFEAAQPITADTHSPVLNYAWSRDGQSILYIQDRDGDENFRIYAVDPAAALAEAGLEAATLDLTPFDGVQARIYARPKQTPDSIIVGLNDRNPALHDVYRLDITTGERQLLLQNDQNVAGWVTDLDGNLRLAVRETDDGSTEILAIQGDSLEPVYTCSFEETCYPLRFHPNGDRVYLVSNRGDDVDLSQLLLLHLDTDTLELVDQDPENQVDFGSAIFSETTDELLATVYTGDRQRIYPQTDAFAQELATLQAVLPDGNLSLRPETDDGRLRLVVSQRDVDPGTVYLFHRDTGDLEKLYDSRPDLPTEHLAAMEPIRYTARDGVDIPGYLTLPAGATRRDLPTVVLPHGGPWVRDSWGYRSQVQFLANRGYAVFQPNFRGSSGFGQAFLNAGNRQWGTGVMQHDITDGVQFLIDEGIADPDRIAIYGASYGGYATLAGLAFTPELYAAGVSMVGPSNLLTFINSVPPYWGPVRQILLQRVGDPDDPADRERLKAQSPLFSADRIRAPLLVIQGANDPRVVQAESDQIVAKLRDLGREIEYLVAPDEGHGLVQETNRLAAIVALEQFLGQHLNGRVQEDVSPEVAARLELLTVDVDRVIVPEA
ncbi:MAG: S9 family peptidase [Leptolyngbya sp. LCM1.Bin17]|nr:MAG: S9 family peptidase [Leptolyngbya sp. LCM1.Bin17]